MAAFLGNDGLLAQAISSLVGEGPVALYKEKLNCALSPLVLCRAFVFAAEEPT